MGAAKKSIQSKMLNYFQNNAVVWGGVVGGGGDEEWERVRGAKQR